jgi:hypothetical protein
MHFTATRADHAATGIDDFKERSPVCHTRAGVGQWKVRQGHADQCARWLARCGSEMMSSRISAPRINEATGRLTSSPPLASGLSKKSAYVAYMSDYTALTFHADQAAD